MKKRRATKGEAKSFAPRPFCSAVQAYYPWLRRHRLWRAVAACLRRRSASRRRRSSFSSSMILKKCTLEFCLQKRQLVLHSLVHGF